MLKKLAHDLEDDDDSVREYDDGLELGRIVCIFNIQADPAGRT